MSENGQVKWEDPPTSRNGRQTEPVWVKRLSPVMEQPNRWANIGTFPLRTISDLRHGRAKIPAGRWEFVSRGANQPIGRTAIYARYLGPEESA